MIKQFEEYFLHEDQNEISMSDRAWFYGMLVVGVTAIGFGFSMLLKVIGA